MAPTSTHLIALCELREPTRANYLAFDVTLFLSLLDGRLVPVDHRGWAQQTTRLGGAPLDQEPEVNLSAATLRETVLNVAFPEDEGAASDPWIALAEAARDLGVPASPSELQSLQVVVEFGPNLDEALKQAGH